MRNMTMLFFCFVTVLAVAFADMRPAFADHGVTAQQASEMGTMQAMKAFVLRVKEHREATLTDDGHAELRDAMRTDGTDWKYENTYVISVNIGTGANYKAGDVITFHAEYPLATDKSLRHIEIFRELMTKVLMLGEGEKAACVEDETGRYGKHICAAITTLTQERGFKNDVISVVGFHHEGDEASAEKIQCPDLGDEYFGELGTGPDGERFTRTSANMVTDRKSLENYLKTVEEMISNRIREIRMAPGYRALEGSRLRQLSYLLQGLTLSRPCWRDEPWTSGSIYFYLIRYVPGKGAAKQYGVFNGLSAQFEDTTLLLYDGCVDVGQTVFQILQENPDGFLEYYWSNPVKDDDIVVDASENPIRGLSPGTSVKLGYFLTTTFGGEGATSFVIGSGIYPEDQEYYVPEGGMCQDIPDYLTETARQYLDEFPKAPEQKKDDDGGCAVASGNQDSLRLAGLNMLLLAAVLFLAVSRRSSSGGKS